MKKLSMLLLLLICTNVMAAWIELKDIHIDGITVYVDIGKIHNRGSNVAKMQHVINYKNKEISSNGVEYLSIKELVEYNCEEEHYRVLASSMHSEPMGEGKVVGFSSDAKHWEPVEFETLEESLWKVACDKSSITHHD